MWKAVWGYYLITTGAVVAALARQAQSAQDQMQEYESDWSPFPKRTPPASDEDDT